MSLSLKEAVSRFLEEFTASSIAPAELRELNLAERLKAEVLLEALPFVRQLIARGIDRMGEEELRARIRPIYDVLCLVYEGEGTAPETASTPDPIE